MASASTRLKNVPEATTWVTEIGATRYAVVFGEGGAVPGERELREGTVVQVLDSGDRRYWLVAAEKTEPQEYLRTALTAIFRVPAGGRVYRAQYSYAPRTDDTGDTPHLAVLRGDLLIGLTPESSPSASQMSASGFSSSSAALAPPPRPSSAALHAIRLRDDAIGLIPREVVEELALPRTAVVNGVSPSTCYNDLATMLLRKDMLLTRALAPLCGKNSADRLAECLVELHADNDVVYRLLRFAVAEEVRTTTHAPTLFRSNSFAALVLSAYAKRVNGEYLVRVVRPALIYLMNTTVAEMEINPDLLANRSTLAANQENLRRVLQFFVNFIVHSAKDCPLGLRYVCAELKTAVEAKFPGNGYSAIGGFLFLRNLCPAIVAPVHHGLLDEVPPEWSRILILTSKVLQTLANGSEFGQKEPFMEAMNSFVRKNKPAVERFFDEVARLRPEDKQDVHYWQAREAPSREVTEAVYRRTSLKDLASLLRANLPEIADHAKRLEDHAEEASLLVHVLDGALSSIAEDELRDQARRQRLASIKMQYRESMLAATADAGESLSSTHSVAHEEGEKDASSSTSPHKATTTQEDEEGGLDPPAEDSLAKSEKDLERGERDRAAGEEEPKRLSGMPARGPSMALAARERFLLSMLDISASATDELQASKAITLETPIVVPYRPERPTRLLNCASYEELVNNFGSFARDIDNELEVQRMRRVELARLLEYDDFSSSEMAEIVDGIHSAVSIARKLRSVKDLLLKLDFSVN